MVSQSRGVIVAKTILQKKWALDDLAANHKDVDPRKLTVFTTLEPCTHEVRSGVENSPCKRLIAAEVKRVGGGNQV